VFSTEIKSELVIGLEERAGRLAYLAGRLNGLPGMR
jgi:hypothetical protein